MASSVLIEVDAVKVVFDFGRGVSQRIYELSLRQDDIQHIVISHFHPDHISDLIPFLHAGLYSPDDLRIKDLNIYGPSGIREKIGLVLDIVGPKSIANARFKVNIHEITDKRFPINNLEFEFIRLSHENNSGLRFVHDGKVYAFTGDIAFDEKEINFLKDSDFAVLNVGGLKDENIIDIAFLTQVKTIVCSHLYRDMDEEKLNSLSIEKGYKGRIVIGRDLMKWTDTRLA
ncbi:MAG: ribonuclease Z [Nitrospirota bacterium]